MKNIALLLVSIIFSLVLCEAGLRLFTPFPITEESNKTDDPVLGYRVSTHLSDTDQHGFRNKPMETYDIAAIGDSFTYGVNVSSEQTWPSLLGKMTGMEVYNFGVGSYGIYTYHAILKTLVNPDAKGVIIGLYPANDFAMIASFCHIKFDNDFWADEIDNLGLALYSNDAYKKHCARKSVNNIFKRFKKYIGNNTAITNAVRVLIFDKIKRQRQDRANKDYFFHDHTINVPKGRTRFGANNTDMENPDFKFMHDDFRKFVNAWSKLTHDNNTRLGILLIPSTERVVFEYYKRKNEIDLLDDNFVRDLEMQIHFDEESAGIMEKLCAGVSGSDPVPGQ